jgi:hypothetical protein
MDPWMGRDRLANKLKTLPHAPMQFPRRRVTFFAHTHMGMYVEQIHTYTIGTGGAFAHRGLCWVVQQAGRGEPAHRVL